MTDSLLTKLETLKNILKDDERIKKLDEVDALLSKDENVMKLAYKKDMASVEFDDALKHFGEDSNEVKQAQKKLYEAKLELDNNPLVKEYNNAYKEVRELYHSINKKIFGDFALWLE